MRKSAAIIIAAVVLALAIAGSAAAQYPPHVKGQQIQGRQGNTQNNGPLVLPRQVQPQAESLPFTGADLTLFVIIGISTVGLGVFVVRRTRRKEAL